VHPGGLPRPGEAQAAPAPDQERHEGGAAGDHRGVRGGRAAAHLAWGGVRRAVQGQKPDHGEDDQAAHEPQMFAGGSHGSQAQPEGAGAEGVHHGDSGERGLH
jgi:hypothetical protein